MIGYPDGRFMPYGNLTRAEAAGLMVRTMIGEVGVNTPRALVNIQGRFSDVYNTNRWYYNYIALAYQHGLIIGFPDGSFRPHQPITREEFAGLMARTTTIRRGGSVPYIDSHQISNWAFDYVYTMFRLGWMIGDREGTFRPLQNITRAEAAALVARALGRGDTTARSIAGVRDQIHIFPDVSNELRWYYYYVLEATNSHWFTRDGNVEIWTRVSPLRR